MLLCRTPGDWISTKEYKKSTCGGTIIRVTIPVYLIKTMQCLKSAYKKSYTKGSRAIKIMKQTVEYTKEKQLYRILVPLRHILLTFCTRIGTFDRSRVSGLVQVFRVSCINVTSV